MDDGDALGSADCHQSRVGQEQAVVFHTVSAQVSLLSSNKKDPLLFFLFVKKRY
jgi:hypothetical protein